MPFRALPPPPGASSSALERVLMRVLGWLRALVLLGIALVFVASLLIWLVAMVVFSLVASLFTGRPAAVTLLWQRYRAMARQRWPQRTPTPESSTPRADAAQATGASRDTDVSDVRWREVRSERGDDSRRS